VDNLDISKDLYYVLSTTSVAPSGTINRNLLDEQSGFISRMYTPNFTVSPVSTKILEKLGLDLTLSTYQTYDTNSLTYFVEHSGIKERDKEVYTILKSVVIDAFSTYYATSVSTDLAKYISKSAIATTIANAYYCIDYLSNDSKYSEQVSQLYGIIDAMGVIRSQMDYSGGKANV
jgi:hypothetical protein